MAALKTDDYYIKNSIATERQKIDELTKKINEPLGFWGSIVDFFSPPGQKKRATDAREALYREIDNRLEDEAAAKAAAIPPPDPAAPKVPPPNPAAPKKTVAPESAVTPKWAEALKSAEAPKSADESERTFKWTGAKWDEAPKSANESERTFKWTGAKWADKPTSQVPPSSSGREQKSVNPELTEEQKRENALKSLGLTGNPTKKEISSAFKKLSRVYHPDHNKNADAVQKFQELNAARDLLNKPSAAEAEAADKAADKADEDKAVADEAKAVAAAPT